MSRNDVKQQLSISSSIMLSMEMTKAAFRLIEGSDFFTWGQADITAEPVREGRCFKSFRWNFGGDLEDGYEDAMNDEVLRTVRIKGYYLGRGGFVQFESKCELHNYRSMWEPRFVDVKIGDTNRHFYYINEWREGRYNSTIKESSPTATA
jgi:hypothetical protein